MACYYTMLWVIYKIIDGHPLKRKQKEERKEKREEGEGKSQDCSIHYY
jgi:hypothetical protein